MSHKKEATEITYYLTYGGLLPDIEAVGDAQAVTDRVAAHIGILQVGETVETGQPTLHTSADIRDIWKLIEDNCMSSIRTIVDEGPVSEGFYKDQDGLIFCAESHNRDKTMSFIGGEMRTLVKSQLGES